MLRTYLIKQEKPYTEIDPNDIELIESIGAGSYGSGIFSNFPLGMTTSSVDRYHENVLTSPKQTIWKYIQVFKAKWKSKNTEVAVKKLLTMEKEANILAMLKEGLIKYLLFQKTKCKIMIIWNKLPQ